MHIPTHLSNNRIMLIPLAVITANPHQARVEYGDIEELAGQIAAALPSFESTLGLMQVPRGRVINAAGDLVPWAKAAPVTQEAADWEERGLSLQLLYGHRRWRAMLTLAERGEGPWAAGLMPAQITDASDMDMLLAVWAENAQRRELAAVEEAALLLAAQHALGEGATQGDVAKLFGLGRSTVANRLGLLGLPEGLQTLNRRGQLSERQLIALKGLVRLAEKLLAAQNRGGANLGRLGSMGQVLPAQYLAQIAAGTRRDTSDQIREYADTVRARWGEFVPTAIAEFAATGDVEAAQCGGCRWLEESRCVMAACLTEKSRQYGAVIATQVAAEAGVAFSDDPADFSPGFAPRLVELFRAGTPCRHTVVGWQAAGYHQRRPYGNGGWSDISTNPREGVVLGHRGPLCADAAAVVTGHEGAGFDRAEAEGAAKVVAKKYGDRARAFILSEMARELAGAGAAMPVINKLLWEGNAPLERLPHWLAKHIFNSGDTGRITNDPYRDRQKWLTNKLFPMVTAMGGDLLGGIERPEGWGDMAALIMADYADGYTQWGASYADVAEATNDMLARVEVHLGHLDREPHLEQWGGNHEVADTLRAARERLRNLIAADLAAEEEEE